MIQWIGVDYIKNSVDIKFNVKFGVWIGDAFRPSPIHLYFTLHSLYLESKIEDWVGDALRDKSIKESFGKVYKNNVKYNVLVMLVLVMSRFLLCSVWFGVLKISCIA